MLRLLYIVLPLGMPFYCAWQRDWQAMRVCLVWAIPAFVFGVFLHTAVVIYNLVFDWKDV